MEKTTPGDSVTDPREQQVAATKNTPPRAGPKAGNPVVDRAQTTIVNERIRGGEQPQAMRRLDEARLSARRAQRALGKARTGLRRAERHDKARRADPADHNAEMHASNGNILSAATILLSAYVCYFTDALADQLMAGTLMLAALSQPHFGVVVHALACYDVLNRSPGHAIFVARLTRREFGAYVSLAASAASRARASGVAYMWALSRRALNRLAHALTGNGKRTITLEAQACEAMARMREAPADAIFVPAMGTKFPDTYVKRLMRQPTVIQLRDMRNNGTLYSYLMHGVIGGVEHDVCRDHEHARPINIPPDYDEFLARIAQLPADLQKLQLFDTTITSIVRTRFAPGHGGATYYDSNYSNAPTAPPAREAVKPQAAQDTATTSPVQTAPGPMPATPPPVPVAPLPPVIMAPVVPPAPTARPLQIQRPTPPAPPPTQVVVTSQVEAIARPGPTQTTAAPAKRAGDADTDYEAQAARTRAMNEAEYSADLAPVSDGPCRASDVIYRPDGNPVRPQHTVAPASDDQIIRGHYITDAALDHLGYEKVSEDVYYAQRSQAGHRVDMRLQSLTNSVMDSRHVALCDLELSERKSRSNTAIIATALCVGVTAVIHFLRNSLHDIHPHAAWSIHLLIVALTLAWAITRRDNVETIRLTYCPAILGLLVARKPDSDANARFMATSYSAALNIDSRAYATVIDNTVKLARAEIDSQPDFRPPTAAPGRRQVGY